MRITSFFFFLSMVLLISSCEPEKDDIDISDIQLDLSVKRLEQDLFETPSENLEAKIPEIQKKYGNFFNIYTQAVLQIGSPEKDGFVYNLKNFTTDPDIKEVYQQCDKKYNDFTPYERQLTDAFKRFQHYFPDSVVPCIVTNISGFNYAAIASDSTLAIWYWAMFVSWNSSTSRWT